MSKLKRLDWQTLRKLDYAYLDRYKARSVSPVRAIVAIDFLVGSWLVGAALYAVSDLVRVATISAGVPVLILFVSRTFDRFGEIREDRQSVVSALIIAMSDLRRYSEWLELVIDLADKMLEMKAGQIVRETYVAMVEPSLPSETSRIATLNPALYSDIIIAYHLLSGLLIPLSKWYDREWADVHVEEVRSVWSGIQEGASELNRELTLLLRRIQDHLHAFGEAYPYLRIIVPGDPEWKAQGSQPNNDRENRESGSSEERGRSDSS